MNNELEHVVYMNKLISIYGGLLTVIQRGIMEDYYGNNLSLQEIADERNISRSAISDCIVKTSRKLDNFEKKLGLCAFIDEERARDDKKINEVINRLEEKINNGI